LYKNGDKTWQQFPAYFPMKSCVENLHKFSMYFCIDGMSINIFEYWGGTVMESLDKISLLLSEALLLLNEYREDNLKDLPSTGNIEWTKELKDILVHAVLSDTISFDDAVSRYNLVPEEFDRWFPLFDEPDDQLCE